MTFSISFLDSPKSEGSLLVGEIALGDFSDRFESSLEHWNRLDYENHWQESVQRVLQQGKSSCLISSITNPASANFIFWWPIYVLDDMSIRIQNQMLFLEECEPTFDEKRPFMSLRTRETMSEDGFPISEWRVTPNDLSSWLTALTS